MLTFDLIDEVADEVLCWCLMIGLCGMTGLNDKAVEGLGDVDEG